MFFLKNTVASGRSNGRSGQFCALLLADKSGHIQNVYHDHVIFHREIVCSVGLLIRVKVKSFYRNA